MNTPGRIKGRTPASLKDAYSQLVDACGGDVPAANIAQKSKTQIQRYTDEGDPDCHMPLLVVLALEAACGEPFVTRFMAMQTHHVLVSVSVGDSAPLSAHMANISREIARLFDLLSTVMADGRIDLHEAAKLRAAIHREIQVLTGLMADLDRHQKVRVV